MRAAILFLSLVASAILSACHSGNLKSAAEYDPPSAPPVIHPEFDPYAPYGQANATWRPPVADRNGTIAKPTEPLSGSDRPDYEHSHWATGAGGGNSITPPGTF